MIPCASISESFQPKYINSIFELTIAPSFLDWKIYRISRHAPFELSIVRVVQVIEEETISDKSKHMRMYHEPSEEIIFKIDDSEHSMLLKLARNVMSDLPLTDNSAYTDGEEWILWSNIYQEIRITISNPTHNTNERGYKKLVNLKTALVELENKYNNEQ